jgi:hypothetical protein
MVKFIKCSSFSGINIYKKIVKYHFYELIDTLDKRTKGRFERFLKRKDEDEVKNKRRNKVIVI